MDYNNYIGKEVSFVIEELQKLDIKIITKDNNSGSRTYDTELVVRILSKENNSVELITSKFRINL